MATIIEESESPTAGRVATVTTSRGDKYLIVVDAALKGLADLFSEYRHEKRQGWTLQGPWWEQEFRKLAKQSFASQESSGAN